jgi:hypothetical protein
MAMARKKMTAVALLSLMSLVAVVAVSAQGDTTGKVSIESKSVAIGVGVSWGEGRLTYRGRTYPFTVNGLSVADLGISKVTAVGDVQDLKKVDDFEGTYTAASAGAAVGAGAGTAAMQNQNGVKMTLTGTGQGVKLTLAASGIDVKLKR